MAYFTPITSYEGIQVEYTQVENSDDILLTFPDDTETIVPQAGWRAIRQSFDVSENRWRSPDDGHFVVYLEESSFGEPRVVRVVRDTDGAFETFSESDAEPDEGESYFGIIARQYFQAHPNNNRKWHVASYSSIWLLTVPYIVSDDPENSQELEITVPAQVQSGAEDNLEWRALIPNRGGPWPFLSTDIKDAEPLWYIPAPL